MDRARHLRNYDLHSWSGLAFGLFIYIVAFTGCFALFHHELLAWEDPARRLTVAENPAPVNDVFADWVNEKRGDYDIEYLSFSYPTAVEPYYHGYLNVHDEEGEHVVFERRWDAHTGAALPERGAGLSLWLLDFHRDLMWPEALGGRTVGRALVGVAGVILMLSIVTGVVAHTKIFQELFTLRFFRSVRLRWQDAHKVLGLWGLPFYSMIAFTGAVLGVVVILAPIVAFLTFKGDTEALYDAVLGAPMAPSGVAAEMISVDDLASRREPESGAPVAFVVMNNWGDETAHFDIYFEPDTELEIAEGYQVSGVTGERIEDSVHENLTLANRFVNAVAPLHYATYGGVALKLLYFVLGLLLAVITALGLMMWVERRLYGAAGARSPKVYGALSALNAGAAAGLPVATAAVFWLDKLYAGEEGARLFWTGVVYFAVWGAGVVYAFLRRNDYAAAREMLFLTGALFAGLPLLNMAATGYSVLSLFSAGHKAAGYVDLALFAGGVLTAAAAWTLPARRPGPAAAKADEAADMKPELAPANY